MKKTPLISIVISTKNEERNIQNCLKSIKNQTYKKIEILVIDNNSTDKTKQVAKKYTNRVFNKGPERNIQRNYGINKSKGIYIAWFDADMILTPRVIEECVDKISKDNKIKALVIPEKSVGKSFWAKCRALEKKCYLKDNNIEAVRLVEKKTLEKVGMLDKNLISGEDWDITSRIRSNNYRISRIESFVKHNEGKLTLSQILKKKYYYATKSLPYINRHIRGPKDVVIFVLRPAFFRNWKLLLTDPLHTVGLFFMKFLEFLVGLIGILQVKINLKK